jgi:hypothetical protein
MKKLLLIAGLAVIATPALADEYYVVRNPTTKTCTITERRPSGGPEVVIGAPFGVRVEAERHMKTVKECTETTGSGGRDVEIKKEERR